MTLSIKLSMLLMFIVLCAFIGGVVIGIKLLMWELRDRMTIVPFRHGDKAYIPIEDFDDHYVYSDCRFGELCVQLMHKGKVDDTVPLSDIGRKVFVSRAAAQRKLGGECGMTKAERNALYDEED